MLKTFDCKKPTFLTDGMKITFDGTDMRLPHSIHTLSKHDHITRLSTFSEDTTGKNKFLLKRVGRAYITEICRPEIALGFAQCSQMTYRNASAMNSLNKVIEQRNNLPIRY